MPESGPFLAGFSVLGCMQCFSNVLTGSPHFIRLRDQSRRFLGDHDGWAVCIAARDSRHDAGVNDPQASYAPNSQRRVYHRHWIAHFSHLGGANRVEDRRANGASCCGQLFVSLKR